MVVELTEFIQEANGTLVGGIQRRVQVILDENLQLRDAKEWLETENEGLRFDLSTTKAELEELKARFSKEIRPAG